MPELEGGGEGQADFGNARILKVPVTSLNRWFEKKHNEPICVGSQTELAQ